MAGTEGRDANGPGWTMAWRVRSCAKRSAGGHCPSAAGHGQPRPRASSSRSMNGTWVSLILRRASFGANHSTRSISGIVIHGRIAAAIGRGRCCWSRSPGRGRLRGPCLDDLAALLADLAELDRHPGGWWVTGLLLELAPGDAPGLLAFVELALRHGPDALVALRPDRAAGVREQDLYAAVRRAAIEEEAGAAPRGHHGCHLDQGQEARDIGPGSSSPWPGVKAFAAAAAAPC